MNVLTSLICAGLLVGAAMLEHDAARNRTSMTLSIIAVCILLWLLASLRQSRNGIRP